MMKQFWITCCLAFLPWIAFSQGVGGGLSLAGVASQIDGDQWGGYKKLGLHFGGFAWYDFNDRLGIQAEILYGHRGSREVVTAYGQISLNYIDLPLLLRVRVLSKESTQLFAEAGPSANLILSARTGFKEFKRDVTAEYNRLNSEVHLGGTLLFQERIGLLARWSYGITNLYNARRPWLAIHYVNFGVRIAFK